MTKTLRFETCPICIKPDMVRLPKDWMQRAFRGESIEVVGCGNPWHYILPSEIRNIGEYDEDGV
jgi:hypothetical protein